MSEIKITKEKIKKLHDKMESCSEAQEAIRETFPEAFKGKQGDITEKCTFEITKSKGHSYQSYFLEILHNGKNILCSRPACEHIEGGNIIIPFFPIDCGYEFKILHNGNFCILEKG